MANILSTDFSDVSVAQYTGNYGNIVDVTGGGFPVTDWGGFLTGVNLVIGGGLPLEHANYMTADTVTVTGADGSPKQSFQSNLVADSPGTSVEQASFITRFGVVGPNTVDLGYQDPVFYQCSYYKFDEKLLDCMRAAGNFSWHIFWEMKAEPDYRMRVQLVYDANLDQIYWVAHDDILTNSVRIHDAQDRTTPVVLAPKDSPLGWHKVEVFVDRYAGIWQVAIDGNILMNLSGANLFGASGNHMNIMFWSQNYSSQLNGEPMCQPNCQLMCDMQLCDEPVEGSVLRAVCLDPIISAVSNGQATIFNPNTTPLSVTITSGTATFQNPIPASTTVTATNITGGADGNFCVLGTC